MMSEPHKKLPKVDIFIYRIKPKMMLINLLDGPLCNTELAERLNTGPQVVSRLLVLAEALDLVDHKREKRNRINWLTDYGRGIAEHLKKSQETAAARTT